MKDFRDVVADFPTVQELGNIVENSPVQPDDIISDRTADECQRRGWVTKDSNGNWVATEVGVNLWPIYSAYLDMPTD